MKKSIYHILVFLLVFLFAYTTVAKLFDLRSYVSDLRSQPFPNWIRYMLIPAIPIAELSCVALLSFSHTRKKGLGLAFVLILGFTIYTVLVLSGVFARMPCPCGGIIKYLSWKGHLVFNGIFLLIAFMGLWLDRRVQHIHA